MTIKLNLDRVEHRPTVPDGDVDTSVQTPPLHGSVTGQIAVGRYVVQIGDACGALIGEASQAEQPQMHARPTPIILRPQPTRGLLDRGMELAAALSALDAGLPIELSGEPGIGKTAVLRHLAHHPHASSFADGIIYLSVRRQSTDDLLQLIFEAFHETDKIRTPTEAEIRRGLQDTQALILLDDVYAAQPELERVFERAPRSAFVVSTRERCLWGEARSLTLKGLPVEDGVRLLEREIERSLDGTERAAAIHLSTALGGHPRRIQQAAALIRDQRISLDRLDRNITPAKLMADAMASIDEKPRRALLALTALAGVPLPVQHVSGIAEVIDLEPSLVALARRGLVVSSQSRYVLADGVSDYLRRTEDLKPWVNRAITYFTAWAERYRRSPSNLLEESEALLRVQECAIDTRRWGEVLHVGRLFEGALIVGARWGAWAVTLDRCLTAAKSIGDRPAEAWTLHEMGTRAVCLGEADKARAQLSQAMKLREAMGDDEGAAASRRNLALVLSPASDLTTERPATLLEQVLDLDSFREGIQPAVRAPKTKSGSLAALVILMIVLLGGLGYLAISPGLSWTPQDLAGLGAFLHTEADHPTVRTASTEQILQAQATVEPRVQRFSAFPDRIVPGESVGLCYEVANGSSVRIESGRRGSWRARSKLRVGETVANNDLHADRGWNEWREYPSNGARSGWQRRLGQVTPTRGWIGLLILRWLSGTGRASASSLRVLVRSRPAVPSSCVMPLTAPCTPALSPASGRSRPRAS